MIKVWDDETVMVWVTLHVQLRGLALLGLRLPKAGDIEAPFAIGSS